MKTTFSAILSPIFIFLLITLITSCQEKKSVISFEAMDTFMTIQAYGKNAEEAANQAKNEILNLENLISTTKESSDIYKINHATNKKNTTVATNATAPTANPTTTNTFTPTAQTANPPSTPSENLKLSVSPQTSQLLSFTLQMADRTQGALNPALYPITLAWGFTTENYRLPSDSEIAGLLPLTDYRQIHIGSDTVSIKSGMMLDLGAVGKGYAGDKAIEILQKNGIKSAILDLGGNIQTLGTKADGSEWSVGIKNPWEGKVAAGLKVTDKAVITSGGYERFFTADDGKNYIHIFDPNTGRPVQNDLASVTIISKKGLYGDALSTALFVMGKDKAIAYWENHHNLKNQDFEMLLITNDKKLIYTPGLAGKIQILADFACVDVVE